MRKFRVPNQIINNGNLSFSARRLAAYFCAASNRFGMCRKSIAMLSGLTGMAPATVYASIDELERSGFLARKKKYRYDFDRRHLIYDRTEYQINKYLHGGYTLVPSELLYRRELSGGAFVLALYLCQQSGSKGRAFPSIALMAEAVGAAKSTICRCLAQLRNLGVFLVQNCVRANHTFAANSYFFLHHVEPVIVAKRQIVRSALPLALHKFYHWAQSKINALGCPKFSKPVINLDNVSL